MYGLSEGGGSLMSWPWPEGIGSPLSERGSVKTSISSNKYEEVGVVR